MRLPWFIAFVVSLTASCAFNYVHSASAATSAVALRLLDRDSRKKEGERPLPPDVQDPHRDPHGATPNEEVHHKSLPAKDLNKYWHKS
jgi:hypothetical protein